LGLSSSHGEERRAPLPAGKTAADFAQAGAGLPAFFAGLALGRAEFFFKDEPIGQTGITDGDADDEIARAGYSRRQSKMMAAINDLLMRDFETAPVFQDCANGEQRHVRDVIAEFFADVSRRLNVNGEV
jgi:hypothetical protein